MVCTRAQFAHAENKKNASEAALEEIKSDMKLSQESLCKLCLRKHWML